MYSWSFIAHVFYESVGFKSCCGVFCSHLSKSFVLIIVSNCKQYIPYVYYNVRLRLKIAVTA